MLGAVGEGLMVLYYGLVQNILVYPGLIAETLNDNYVWNGSHGRSGSGNLISHGESVDLWHKRGRSPPGASACDGSFAVNAACLLLALFLFCFCNLDGSKSFDGKMSCWKCSAPPHLRYNAVDFVQKCCR